MGEASKAATQHTYRYTLHVHTCMYTHACTHMHVHMHVHTCMYTHACTHMHVHTCMYTHACTHACTHMHVHTCMYTHACTHIHVQIHMYMYMYTYTCTHTCTHTCTVQVFIKTGPLHTWSGGMHMTMLQCVGETSPSCRYLDQRSMNTASPAVLWVVD